MGRFQRALDTIRRSMVKMTGSQKLLIASLAVVMAMTLFVVQQYASEPDLVPLIPGLAPEEAAEVEGFLKASYTPYEVRAGEIMVRASDQRSVVARLAEQGKTPGDTRLLFDNLVDKQSWTKNYQQNEQMALIARQNELSRVIQQMEGIRKATVIMDVPKRRGLGQADRPPTASVTVFGAQPLTPNEVDAVAGLVAASTSGLDVARVRVIDGLTNRQHSARKAGAYTASSYLEHQTKIEERKRTQLLDMLGSYIPGVTVMVHAQADTRRQVSTSRLIPNEGEGSAVLQVRASDTASESQQAVRGGPAGVRPNTGVDIEGSAGVSGPSMTETTTTQEFAEAFGENVTTVEDPRGYPIRINAVVNIPKPYFEAVWRELQGPDTAEDARPSEEDLRPVVNAEIERIESEVRYLVDSSAKDGGSEGEVSVSMIPVTPSMLFNASANSAGGLATGAVAGVPITDVVKTVGVGGLALLSLGLVVLSAFKANRRVELPTAEELVGLPPALEDNSDVIGEAGEADSVLSGLELSEDEMKHRKMLQQIDELIGESPDRAASIMTAWLREDH
jgi:flagellar biosynthesis/type III secretory pathway M-ring protein FliF/YscJ